MMSWGGIVVSQHVLSPCLESIKGWELSLLSLGLNVPCRTPVPVHSSLPQISTRLALGAAVIAPT